MTEKEDGIIVRPGFVIPESELQFTAVASSGPGGQKVNKTATKIRLKWRPRESTAVREALSAADQERLLHKARKHLAEDGSFQVVSDRFRTQESNRDECRRKLALAVTGWLKKPKKRIPTRPSRASKEKRIEEKRRTSRLKQSRRRVKPEE